MDNIGIRVEDTLEETDLSTITSIGMDSKQMARKINKFKDMEKANGSNKMDKQFGQSLIQNNFWPLIKLVTFIIVIGFCIAALFSIGWHFGEKFGELKMERENSELRERVDKTMKLLDGLMEESHKSSDENGRLKEENAEKDREIEQMKWENAEMQKEMAKKIKELKELEESKNEEKTVMEEQIAKMKGNMTKLTEENDQLKEEIARKNSELVSHSQIVEIKGVDTKLEKMRSELEKQIEEKMANLTNRIAEIEENKFISKENKLNSADCGKGITISGEGMLAKYTGKTGFNSVRAILPIPPFNMCMSTIKPSILFYYEMQILKMDSSGGLAVGICTQHFPLEGTWLGAAENSIGIFDKGGIWIGGSWSRLENATEANFKELDVVGLGIIKDQANSSMKCFFTWNGELIGKIVLPSKYTKIQLFPAINLYNAGELIRANFGKEQFRFNLSQFLQ